MRSLRSSVPMTPNCLVVGAGLTGLTAARLLKANGWRVCVVDKGRNAGGRMATWRKDGLAFDHGAQFFTARTHEFQCEVTQWLQQNWVAEWFGEPGRMRYRSTDGMNGLAARLSSEMDVRLSTAVSKLHTEAGRWTAHCADSEPLQADALILTAPVPQSIALLEGHLSPGLQADLARITYAPCLALLATLAGPSGSPPPGYLRLGASGPLEVISDNTLKGISDGPAAVTIHSTADFARDHWDTAPETVATLLLQAARKWLASPAADWQLRRWRFCEPVHPYPSACLTVTDAPAPLVLAGDAFGGPRVEGAYLSGLAAARSLLNQTTGVARSLPASAG